MALGNFLFKWYAFGYNVFLEAIQKNIVCTIRIARAHDSFEIIIFALNIFCVPVDIFQKKEREEKTLHKYKFA